MMMFPNIWGFAEPLLTGCWCYNNTGSTCHRQRAITPAQNRYIRLMHFRVSFRTATSTTNQIPGLRRISSQTDAMFSRHIISLNDVPGVKNLFSADVHRGQQFSFPMNVASWCCCLLCVFSEQINVLEYMDIIMNVMLPIVFWNMIVSMVAAS